MKKANISAHNKPSLRNKSVNADLLRLYAVTLSNFSIAPEQAFAHIEQALQGGITCLQLREKTLKDNELLAVAFRVKKLCDDYHVPLIINDNPDLAKKIGATGVHLGQGDMAIASARKLLGNSVLIGISAHNLDEAHRAEATGADYLGVGAVFPTTSKNDATPLDVRTVKEICQAVNIPVVAIGGIDKSNMHQLQYTGIAGVAVISAIFNRDNVYQATQELNKMTGQLFSVN